MNKTESIMFLVTQKSLTSGPKYCKSEKKVEQYVWSTFTVAEILNELPEISELDWDGKVVCVKTDTEGKQTFLIYKCVVKDNGWVRSCKRLIFEKVDEITVVKIECLNEEEDDVSTEDDSLPFVKKLSELMTAFEEEKYRLTRTEMIARIVKVYDVAYEHLDEIKKYPKLVKIMKNKLREYYEVNGVEQFLHIYEKMFGPIKEKEEKEEKE